MSLVIDESRFVFPKFNRLLFDQPKEMFGNVTFEDGLSILLGEKGFRRSDFDSSLSTEEVLYEAGSLRLEKIAFEGWVPGEMGPPTLRGSGKNSWTVFYEAADLSGEANGGVVLPMDGFDSITFSAAGVNSLIGTNQFTVYENHETVFPKTEHHNWRVRSPFERYTQSKKMYYVGMSDTELPLAHALFWSAVTQESAEDGVAEPVFNFGGKEGNAKVRESLDLGTPFDVFKASVIALGGGMPKDLPIAVVNLLGVTESIHKSGISG